MARTFRPGARPMASRNLADLLPKVEAAAHAAITACEAAGLSVLVTATYRTGEEQTALYDQGRTTPGTIITDAKAGQSMHQYRCALDIVPLVNGKPDWDGTAPEWHAIATIFKAHGFEWGYDWPRFKEMPHFQITGGFPLSHFQNGGTL